MLKCRLIKQINIFKVGVLLLLSEALGRFAHSVSEHTDC